MYDYHQTSAFHRFHNLRQTLSQHLNPAMLSPTELLRELSLTSFLEVIDRAGMSEEINNAPALTLYVPTNEAFAALSLDDTKEMTAVRTQCRELVKTHCVYGFFKFHGALDSLKYFDQERWTWCYGVKIKHQLQPAPNVITSSRQPNACALPLYYLRSANGGMWIIDAVLGSSDQRQYEVLDGTRGDNKEVHVRDLVAA